MNEQPKNNFNEETIDLVITVAYGSANFFDTIKAWFLIKKHDELKAIYDEYRLTANSVHSLHDEMPNHILDKVELATGVELSKGKDGFFSDLTGIFLAKPQIVFIATAIVVALLVSSVFFKEHQQIDTQYSQAEIELANKQARQTLMLVSKIFNSTQETVTEEIIPNRVVKPLNESLGYVNNLFKQGDI